MNYLSKVTILIISLFLYSNTADAQFWKKLKKKAEDAVINKADKKMDDVLNGKKGKKQNKSSEKKTKPEKEVINSENTNSTSIITDKQKLELYRNFKFIPGEKIIFYDDLAYEEIGEFPSKWDLLDGGSEVVAMDDEKAIIITNDYDNVITPLFDTTNYLGDEFTIEFDIYIDNLEDVNDWQQLEIYFVGNITDYKDVISRRGDIKFNYRKDKISGYIRTDEQKFGLEEVNFGAKNSWHHIAISYYKKKLKIYHDETRIGNIPNFPTPIKGVAFNLDKPKDNNDENLITAIKNVRIAHGGGQMYKRILSSGKYMTNGILFDTGKAIIKPQSMGIINKIVSVLKQKKDWNFEIIGHTDSDGDAKANLKLSKERADAVKEAIVKLGIKKERLTTLGKGESTPLNTNSNSIEKANNRRVEFIRK